MKSKLKKVAALTVLAAAMGASWSAHSANLTGKWVTGYCGAWYILLSQK